MLYNFCGTWTWEIVKKGNNDQRELMKNKINGCVNLKVRINGEKYAVGSGFYIRDEILMEMPRYDNFLRAFGPDLVHFLWCFS